MNNVELDYNPKYKISIHEAMLTQMNDVLPVFKDEGTMAH